MTNYNLSQRRHQRGSAPADVAATVAAIGASLRWIYPVNDQLVPALQEILSHLADHC